MNKSQAQPDDTRERLLQAAADIMAERGYARATTRAIAEAAQVNEVTLFRHFGSKRNLLSEVIQSRSALPDLKAIFQDRLSGDYRQDLVTLGTAFYQAITQRKEALRLILCEAQEMPDLQGVLVQIPDQLREILTAYFKAAIAKGHAREMDPEVMAQGFLGMFFSYGIAREILNSSVAEHIPAEELIAQFVDIFVDGTYRA